MNLTYKQQKLKPNSSVSSLRLTEIQTRNTATCRYTDLEQQQLLYTLTLNSNILQARHFYKNVSTFTNYLKYQTTC